MSLYTYPSNKLEYLVKVLTKLLDIKSDNIFTPTQFIVGSRGMQHWLSMELAKYRSIAMNFKYDMVNGYINDLCYELTAKQEYKHAYKKDFLAWRIFKKIDRINNPKLYEYYQGSDLKKYQLSHKIAETFAKYLLYRSDWLRKWEKGGYINSSNPVADEEWQLKLWQILVEEVADVPYKIQEQALKLLSQDKLKKLNIPNDIYIFGVNTISVQNLQFIFTLARHINIHILYLNPCSEYWYDLHKSKVSSWLDNDDYEIQPLLANFGQQGKDFFSQLLDEEDKQELEIFENFDKKDLDFAKLENYEQTQLISLQRNLLELNCYNYANTKDSSISIHSCHSPLREVQVLHDRLLDLIKADPSIKPRDILVMCPNIEDYAPYIDSVFSRSATDKKLPCSIADRTLIDSEPLVASFIDLLQLPDSNFEVNKIFDYLSVPAIQKKFKITAENLDTIRYWIKEACIHHSNNGEMFSWSWGLKRLMLGFSYSDSNYIVNDKLMTVSAISGSEVIELGSLYELLELLEKHSCELLQLRSCKEWQDYLLTMFEDLFDVTEDEKAIASKIKEVVAKTLITAQDILVNEKIDLYTLRYCLISELSKPIVNNHFLNGKVTFCSMTPMRSIPFRVIAMLGLNSGKFPRQESAISFDLMARLGRVKGDRSRRDDDRYLFLETIISARDHLYISYIGKSVKTNVEQQPSLVLKELISYLCTYYDWQEKDIIEYPLHPFSYKCYSGEYISYDKDWLRVLQSSSAKFYDKYIAPNKVNLPKKLNIFNLVKIFVDPLKAYVNYGLDLYLEDVFDELEDSEPFDIDSLNKYKFRKELLSSLITDHNADFIIKSAKLSGKFPDSVLTDREIELEVVNMQSLLGKIYISNYEYTSFNKEIFDYELQANCYIKDNQIMLFAPSSLNIEKKFGLYLTSLLVACDKKIDIRAIYFAIDNNKNKSEVVEFVLDNISYKTANELLESYISFAEKIISKPMLVHLCLAEALYDAKNNTDKKRQNAWNNKVKHSKYNYNALEDNIYFKLFYDNLPNITDFVGKDIYENFFDIMNQMNDK